MELFLARQPIFDRQLQVQAYELLYRGSELNRFEATNGASASLEVISNSLVAFGLDKVAGGRQCFVNIDSRLLLDGCHFLVPAPMFVLEILESVPRTDEVVEACRRLKKAGFRLALDDFVRSMLGDPLVEFADLIKIDFRESSRADLLKICEALEGCPASLLAEKVETKEEFQWAHDAGFQYFQGYFFARPSLMRCREVPGYKLNHLRILREAHRPEIDIERLAELIRREVSLFHRLLRYINSALFTFRNRVSSVQEALSLLGEKEIRRWTCLATLPSLAKDKPAELVVNSMVRAKFSERLAAASGLPARQEELFVIGILSHLDAILDRPMGELLTEIPLPESTQKVLCSSAKPGDPVAELFHLVLRYEAADWTALQEAARRFGLSPAAITEAYRDAIEWAAEIYRETQAS